MKLEQLMEGVPFTLVQGSLDTEIADIIYDSRKAAPGLLFVCIVGTQRDSHEFAADCAAKGVSVLVIQHDIDLSAMPGVTVVKVDEQPLCHGADERQPLWQPLPPDDHDRRDRYQGQDHHHPHDQERAGSCRPQGGHDRHQRHLFMGRHQETANTTPESYELQKTFREFLDAGCDTALMEVSSQG